MQVYNNDFVYGRNMLKKLMPLAVIGCIISLLLPKYTYIHMGVMALTVVIFVVTVWTVFKYCRCPNCGKVIFFGVAVVKTCPRCHRNLETGKKVKKSKR